MTLRTLVDLFRINAEDPELARAQFRSFSKQVPLLCLILVCNSAAIIFDYFRSDQILKSLVIPLAMCAIASARGIWWWRQDGTETFSDAEITKYIKRTGALALILTAIFAFWCMWIYPQGDAYARGHMTFFLGLTQISTVFCLMTLRAAAMRVALLNTTLFIGYFAFVDDGRMVVPSIVLGIVGLGMMVVTYRYNLDFAQLILSRRDLRNRQAEAERLSEENHRIALTDALSGLPNRRALLARLDQVEKESVGQADGLAIVFIDLDGFKDINDAHGHQAGDVLIQSLSARLTTLCPPYAMLARVGGDEFAVLIQAHGASAEALLLAQTMHDEICLPVLGERTILQVGASIGVAGDVEGAVDSHELLRRADMAMYHVKLHRKGEIAAYDPEFDAGRLRRLAIEEDIGSGLQDGEFDVFYQPVVDATSGAIVATEALIRWPRRANGPLNPDQFIEIAEATGQIHPLGLFVLERACRDLVHLEHLKVSVNVSPAQFRDPGFGRQVAHILEQACFPPERLQFEITEGYLLAQPELAKHAIESFKAMGMSIALDDFGTGYTSLYYLQSYGFSHIKIDKSLLVGLQEGSKAQLLITGAIYLACGLDMQLIAEGVETEEQAKLLRVAGCHNLQGYLFGRPMPIQDFLAAYASSVATRRTLPRPRGASVARIRA